MDTQPSEKILVRYFPRYSIYKKVSILTTSTVICDIKRKRKRIDITPGNHNSNGNGLLAY